ncbi:tRNA (adenosine(37)-N6)-dimethylallyltransferase MiaA [Brucepastera parasyntrophica]|uniref:tRNA (adenosine(37)-N6)-dimethylallyltransferase MiaA n=1 Tax=Brucepastera parasyntrophica TaxID=2880008 RepID=UPI00210B91DC|nr:tRNA (adenosine(37)-N6)-dimethylallyltransferase MiaA [Brucepastera parasyntrophica]ULQ59698.1 tRNA (adenosine(37)-N6)-dimethylallyltransferase MiaA [Brucepastera parasyntrophica]
MEQLYDSLIILGPTACGKTNLGVYLANQINGEIISVDSRQVYRGLDIGSGKDLDEYGKIPYHLIDIAGLDSEYNVFDFHKDASRAYSGIRSRGNIPVFVGGTGMYLDAIIRGYDFVEVPVNPDLRAELAGLPPEILINRLLSLRPEVHNSSDLIERPRLVRAIEIAEFIKKNKSDVSLQPTESRLQKPFLNPYILGVRIDRSELRKRIRDRLESRIQEGMIEEVRNLNTAGIGWERLERLGLEYRYTAELLQGKISSEKEYTELLYTAICQFAKRQETWFRRMERKGVQIAWVKNGNRGDALALITPVFPAGRIE